MLCNGETRTFIGGESSRICTVCGWIGWPRYVYDAERQGVIQAELPHERRTKLRDTPQPS